jgi:hypothetical protein
MRALRTKSVSTKLTEDEYAALEALAGGRSLSEFAREILLEAARRKAQDEILLAEVLALRTILLNWHFAVANGDTPSEDDMRQLIEQADQDRFQWAQERLIEFKRRQA